MQAPRSSALQSGLNYHNFTNTIPGGSVGHNYHTIGSSAAVMGREIGPPQRRALSPSSTFGRDTVGLATGADFQQPPKHQPQPFGYPQPMHGQTTAHNPSYVDDRSGYQTSPPAP